MPVYVVNVTAGKFSPIQKQAIAKAITKAHHELTGTHGFLAQVIVNEQEPGNVFLNGVAQDAPGIFIHGLNRAGRPAELKSKLILRLVDDIAAAVSIAPRYIWIYIDEMAPAQMVEYGHVLPEPGGEAEWLKSLPEDERRHMDNIERASRQGS